MCWLYGDIYTDVLKKTTYLFTFTEMDWFIMVLLIRQHRVENGTEGHGHPKLHYMATPLIKGAHCCSSNLIFMFSVHIFIVIYFAHSAFPYCHGKFNMTFTNRAWWKPLVPLSLCAVFLHLFT